MKIQRSILIQAILLFNNICFYGQYTDVEQVILFQSRMDNPILIEPVRDGDRYLFYATNRSFYPYQVQLSFTDFRNLTPEIIKGDYVVQPGKKTLFTLEIVNKEVEPSFRYTTTYRIGTPSEDVD
jgi:hypothetical protein